MNIIEKFQLLLWLKNLPQQIRDKGGSTKMGAKINALLAKLDGLKSVLGLLMVVGYYEAPQFGVKVPDVVLKIGTGFASVGLAMKLEKGANLLSKGLDIAHKALDVMQKVVDSLAAKKPA